MAFQYPPLVIAGKQAAAQGKESLQQWLTALDRKDRDLIEPYLAVLRAIAKEPGSGR